MNFLSEDVRRRFHLLPVEKQQEFTDLAEHFPITITFVDEDTLEVSVRFDSEANIETVWNE